MSSSKSLYLKEWRTPLNEWENDLLYWLEAVFLAVVDEGYISCRHDKTCYIESSLDLLAPSSSDTRRPNLKPC